MRKHALRHRGWLISALAIALAVAAFRLVLTPVARHYSHRALDSVSGYRGSFDDVSLSLVGLRYRISGLAIARDPGRGHVETFVAKSLEARLRWSDLWRLRLSAVLQVEDAKATYVVETQAQLQAAIQSAEALADLPDLGEALERLVPFRIARVEVRDGELLVVDRSEKGVADASRELWVHDVAATIENVGSRGALLRGEPATLALAAKLQRKGELSLFLTLDPLAYELDVEGELAIRHLPLEELYGFIVGKTELEARRGVLDAFATFRCQNGYLSGSVKPILTHVELAPTQKNAGNELLAAATNAAVGLTAEGPEREVATVIPFSGRVTDTEAHVWPALLVLLGKPTAGQERKSFAALPAGGAERSASRPNDEAKAQHRRPGRPPLSSSPQGVFEPGAIRTIQAALSRRGGASPATGTLAGATEHQLTDFQEGEGLPATGFPDRETLRRLGLSVDDLYRSNRD